MPVKNGPMSVFQNFISLVGLSCFTQNYRCHPGSDAIWVITESLADYQVWLDLRGLEDLGGLGDYYPPGITT